MADERTAADQHVEPVQHVARELGLLIRSLKNLHAVSLEGTGLRVEMAATAALAVLADRGTLRPSALADALHLDLSSVSRQVASLEREGWVARERDPADSRATLLQLTPAGAETVARVRAARVAHLRRLLPDWSDAELEAFAASLHRFRSDLESSQAAPPAPPPRPAHETAPQTAPDRTPALAGQETA